MPSLRALKKEVHSEGGRPSEIGLGGAAVRGVFWTGGGQLVRQGIQIITSVALARLLVPDDFGILGMALVLVGFAQLLADFGIGSAIVQTQAADQAVLSSCFWLNVAVTGVVALAVAALSPLAAIIYQDPRVAHVLPLLALNLVTAGVQVVPTALLYKELSFAAAAKAQAVGSA